MEAWLTPSYPSFSRTERETTNHTPQPLAATLLDVSWALPLTRRCYPSPPLLPPLPQIYAGKDNR